MALTLTFRNLTPPKRKRKVAVATTPPVVAPQVPVVPKPIVPSVPTFGANARFRAMTLEWCDDTGATHT
jgi:hypothetical protein